MSSGIFRKRFHHPYYVRQNALRRRMPSAPEVATNQFFVPSKHIYAPELLIPGKRPVGKVQKNYPHLQNAWLINRVRDDVIGHAHLDNSGIVKKGDTFSFEGAEYANAPFTVEYPFSVAIRVKIGTGVEGIVSIANSSLSNEYHIIYHNTYSIIVRSMSGGSYSNATFDTEAAGWYSVVGVWLNDSDRRIYVDGIYRDTAGVARDVTPDRIDVGRFGDSSPSSYFEGDLDYVFYTNNALTEAEALQIHKDPYNFFLKPAGSEWLPFGEAEAGGLSIPVAYHHYSKNIGQ